MKHKYNIIIIFEIRYYFAITNIISFNTLLNMIAIWWNTLGANFGLLADVCNFT